MATYAEIITIGDEILYGQTLDTNSHWISARLDEIGIRVIRKTTIGDQEEEILNSLAEAESRADVILITGGLGPTNDDLTKPCLVKYFNTHLVFNEEAYRDLKLMFDRANKEITGSNRKQAELPAVCEKITNLLGTAPGMWFNKGEKVFVSMPGVPYEMKKMMSDTVLPRLREKYIGGVIYHKIIRTIGIPESTLSDRISGWENQLPGKIKLAYLPTLGMVKLRLTAIGEDKAALEQAVNDQIEKVLPLIDKYVYGYDDDEIEYILGRKLLAAEKTLACAESCTGGYLSHLITSIPGSSMYFKGTIVSYSNEVKSNTLGVRQETLDKYGAVSEETVTEMAQKIREKLNADVGLAVSGIAGPDGGTEEKPVGTVWIAYSDKEKTTAKKFNFSKDRILNIQLSAFNALNMLRTNFSGN